MAFYFYLKVFNLDIFVMIQSLGGITLLQVYVVVVRPKNSLIDAKKLHPRPLMPIFPEMLFQS